MLLVATVIPSVTSIKNNTINATVPSTPLGSMAGDWNETQKLLASDGAVSDYFGCSVSLSGNTALIGASNDDNYKGSAYVFTRTGTTWTQQAKLLASDGVAYYYFGYSVSLDGDTALIGAPGNELAYIFTRTGITWTQQAKLLASDGAAGDGFGCSVSLSGDIALIGAPTVYETTPGSAYVFTRTGTTWTQQAKLLASDGVAGDNFGWSVSLSGYTALIAVPGDSDNGVDSGSAYVFIRTGTTWTQQAKLLPTDGAAGDNFGFSVSLSGDTAFIGADGDDDNEVNSGSAYVFIRTRTTWTQQAKLLASDGAAEDWFGCSVSLNDNTALIAAEFDNDNGEYSGSVYVFTRTGTTWTQQAKLLASDGAAGDEFGCSVSLDGGTALIGAYYDDDNGAFSGSAYVFTREGGNQPPSPPTITGPVSGKKGQSYPYTFVSTDPEGNNVSYYVDWGDDTNTGWIGPYASGIEIVVNHTWDKRGTYTIKAKARDVYGNESDWSDPLPITMPLDVVSGNTLFLIEVNQSPNASPLLRQLLTR